MLFNGVRLFASASKCNIFSASFQATVEMYKEANMVHGLIGEGCSAACIKSGLLATVWDLPFVAIRCLSAELSNKKVECTQLAQFYIGLQA